MIIIAPFEIPLNLPSSACTSVVYFYVPVEKIELGEKFIAQGNYGPLLGIKPRTSPTLYPTNVIARMHSICVYILSRVHYVAFNYHNQQMQACYLNDGFAYSTYICIFEL